MTQVRKAILIRFSVILHGPCHEAALPRVRPAPSEAPDQVAVSVAVGALPPQLAPLVKSVPVAASP